MSLQIQYTGADACISLSANVLTLKLPVPHLGAGVAEDWPMGSRCESAQWQREGDWYVLRTAQHLWFCALADAGDAELEANSLALYSSLLALLAGYRLQRIWHYLPRINETGAGGLERYQAFCRARSLAFEAAFAEGFEAHLPAASGVGCEGGSLVIYGCAARGASVQHLENPLQIPAYRYPSCYGPRAPGFARASATQWPAVDGAKAGRDADCDAASKVLYEVYVSGTASIRDADSVLDGGLEGQLAVTVENMRRIAAEAQLGELFVAPASVVDSADASAGRAAAAVAAAAAAASATGEGLRVLRRFKVYLRRQEDYARVAAAFDALLLPTDEVSYVRSDICRSELDLEIEASVVLTTAC